MSNLLTGQRIIKRYLETIPGSPGVYRMLDEKGDALYVGKARNLKNRVAQYTQIDRLGARLQRMVAQTAGMEITTTRSEAEALLLEANLIKKLSPRYNILLKDDKSFPYILLSGDHAFPRISKHRGPKTKKGRYYGPFTSARAVDETITLLQKAFLLRPCSDNVFKHRTRPCLQYQIKRCSAPCVNYITPEDYGQLVLQAERFLSGKSPELQQELVAQMQDLSLAMHYEKASAVRDRIRAIAQVQQEGGAQAVGDADIVALARDGEACCIQLASYRGGRNYGGRSYFPQHTESYSDAEIISAFLGHHYQTQMPPGSILTSHLLEDGALLEDALRLRAGSKVDIAQPLRGGKRDLVDLALKNAAEALARRKTLKENDAEALRALASLFGLAEPPARIEIYDNSHISGAHAVGAMVVAGPEGFMKSQYRKFHFPAASVGGGDDYAMMRDMLARRFAKLAEEVEGHTPRPDLVLIDGGAGQLSAAQQALDEAGVQGVVVAAIAKGPDRNAGREWFHLPGRDPFQLPKDDPALHYLQRLRDEAHRFAIGAHRGRRSRAAKRSELDAIAGIGPARKKALLAHFGSARAVGGASVDDLMRVPGVSRAIAETIYAHFHG